jgi:hypothetical protein
MKRIAYQEIKESIAFRISCITVIILLYLSLNVAGFVVGAINQNATCYQDKYNISLAQWLILENSVAIVSAFLYLISLVLFSLGYYESMFALFIFIISSGFFFFVMLISGIIELAHQFPSCKSEIESVCGMVILNIVLSLIYTVSSFLEK